MSISTYEISVPKKIYSPTVDKDLEFDSTLPEHCPDIARIIKVDCTPFVESCTISDGQSTVIGKAVYDLLYETDYKNRLRCCSFTQDFSISTPISKGDISNLSAFSRVCCEKISCRLLSPRRVIIKSSLCADFDIEGESICKAIAIDEDGETFFRKKTVGFDGRESIYQSDYSFSELLPLAQSEKCIGEIVCGSITLQSPQINIQNGIAEIRTTATIHTLCEEENNEGKYYASAKTMPLNIEYQNEAIGDYKSIRTELIPFGAEFVPELDQYGESRVIKTSFSIRVNMHISEPKAYSVADDMFEKNHDSTPVVASISLPHTIAKSSVRDFGTTVEITDEGAVLSGNLIATLLVDTAEGIYSFDHPIPFRQILGDFSDRDDVVTATTGPFDSVVTLHSDGSASLRIISDAQLFVRAESKESFLSDVSKRTPRQVESEDSVLIYCFPKKNEDLWSVAKLYRVDPESITTANPNRFDEQGIITDSGKPILINI